MIGALVDPDVLRASASAHLVDDRWQERLAWIATQPATVDSGTLRVQVATTLCRYAAGAPFMLVIDDLHDAMPDTLQCVALLAHMLRDTVNLPFLLASAYRPEAVCEDSPAGEVTLGALLPDIQRWWPDAIVDLASSTSPVNGRAYIDGRLDLIPNHLDAPFRAALFAKTGGLPFLVENTLWTLQDSGQVRQGPDGVLTLHGNAAELDLSSSISAMIGQGLVLHDLGEPRRAEAIFLQALPLLRALGDVGEESRAEGLLAHALYSLGRYDEAMAHAEQAFDLAEGIRDDSLAAESRLAAANCLLDLGRYEAGDRHLRGRDRPLPARRRAARGSDVPGRYRSLPDRPRAMVPRHFHPP